MVKSDAYGTGIEKAVAALLEAGCTTFFVAFPEEGFRARSIAPEATVYVLNGLNQESIPLFAEAKLRPVLGDPEEIAEWAAYARNSDSPQPCALHVDTGMNRLGLSAAQARKLAADEDLLASLSPTLVMSHLACANTPSHPMNALQIARFAEIRELYPDIPASLANSAAMLGNLRAHFDLLRPGIALYGGQALDNQVNQMEPVITLEARIIQLRHLEKGEMVGYGAAQTLARASRIAILGAGYADGYHRRAGSSDACPGATTMISGYSAPVVGRVSMDLIAVDVTDVPEDYAQRGAWVELFGKHVLVDDVAECAGTIGYELLTGLRRRYQRIYVG